MITALFIEILVQRRYALEYILNNRRGVGQNLQIRAKI